MRALAAAALATGGWGCAFLGGALAMVQGFEGWAYLSLLGLAFIIALPFLPVK